MTKIHLKGPGLNNYFAQQMIKDYGPKEALLKTAGPMHEAVKRLIREEEEKTKGPQS